MKFALIPFLVSCIAIFALCAFFIIFTGLSVGVFYQLEDPVDTFSKTVFSETRAMRTLTDLNFPHPSGSWAILAAQKYLFDKMTSQSEGIAWVKVEKDVSYPHNVWGIVEGTSGAPDMTKKNTFLVNAHYDTQTITPGAQG